MCLLTTMPSFDIMELKNLQYFNAFYSFGIYLRNSRNNEEKE